MVLQCPTHGFPNKVLLEYFYKCLESVNRGVIDKLSLGYTMRQPYTRASQLLDGMPKINKAWYTHQDKVSHLNYKLTKENI